MVVLALETVTRAGSVAVIVDGNCFATTGDATRTHAGRLPEELLSCLRTHGRTLADVDRLAVITGPGSFTGLRVGIAAMQGLALAHGRTIVPLPTLEAMALAWIPATGVDQDTVIVPCLDGQRGEVFSAGWRIARGSTLAAADAVMEARVSP